MNIHLLELIYLYFPPSSHLIYICMFLSCRPFVVITTLSTGLVGVEVTSVNKGKLILTEIFPSVQKHDI